MKGWKKNVLLIQKNNQNVADNIFLLYRIKKYDIMRQKNPWKKKKIKK